MALRGCRAVGPPPRGLVRVLACASNRMVAWHLEAAIDEGWRVRSGGTGVGRRRCVGAWEVGISARHRQRYVPVRGRQCQADPEAVLLQSSSL